MNKTIRLKLIGISAFFAKIGATLCFLTTLLQFFNFSSGLSVNNKNYIYYYTGISEILLYFIFGSTLLGYTFLIEYLKESKIIK